MARFVILSLLAAIVAVVGLSGEAGAISNTAPSTAAADGYGGSGPRFAIENKPEITSTDISAPVYLPNQPTGNVTIRVINFRYPWEHEQPRSQLIGVRFNGGPVMRADHSFTVPASAFTRDSLTGYWRTVIRMTGEGGPFNYRNTAQFRIGLDPGLHPGALIGIMGNRDYTILPVEYYTSDASRVFNYNVPFATPCNITSNTNGQIILRDLDSGHEDNLFHNISVSVRNETTGSNVPISTSGGTGNNQTYNINMTFQPGHRYRLVVRNVHANNSLRFRFPFDNINYAVRCNWDVTGSTTINRTTAAPGDVVRWTHTIRNQGPSPTNSIVVSNAGRSYGSAIERGESPAGRPVGVMRTFNTDISVNQGHVGNTYCQWAQWDPTNNRGGRHGRGAQRCVTIPFNYTLTPVLGDVMPDVVEAGAGLSVSQSSVTNSGPTKSKPTRWQLTQFVLQPGATRGAAASASDPCVYYGNNQCSSVRSGSNVTFNVGTSAIGSSQYNLAAVPDLDVGWKVCFGLSVKDRSSSDTRWQHSAAKCTIIGKKPKVQIHGGDLSARGRVSTSTSTKPDGTYGSWGEYAALAQGTLNGFKSAASIADPTTTIANQDLLTFTNTAPLSLGSFTSVSYWARPIGAPADKIDSLETGTGMPGGSMASWPSGTYRRSGNFTLPGGTIPPGRSIVIVSTGTVTINSNITYSSGTLSSLSDIPQVVIIANNINITNAVTQVDAWLLSPTGVINTCSSVAASANLSSSTCNQPLMINGPVIADRLLLRRTAGSGSGDASGDPAEVINLRADAYLWAYMRAGGSGRAQTVLTLEKAPRY